MTDLEQAEALSLSPEGILAGQISTLIGEAVAFNRSEAETFLEAWRLIREYGDKRAKGEGDTRQ